ncbi:cyclic pyranopterin monophosphate synthase MoaC/MOSC-domain-containing protein [Anaerocellum danielii]|uniref:Cyclic pyranopterin monophosphate synthase MoaC/MOSC-domain-containing protein n=1 Tax=Anaerocellum danielii TaxID=1387557 RepID=A0ABZ0U1K5_9FIRM|nr:cyclic pyranopterin monophosphate synthase MoaC/MOSC-domain-containing protein [Caldicellulosiruptor danielii]WPX09596.1 cyclic pyranopterin monophosphate synthase MoaC/MOSC-domain-containing protein [Caldicellulosiruptor danielii]
MEFTHFDKDGLPKMVDVTSKEPSFRVARASGKIIVGKNVIEAIENGLLPKGDVFVTAKIAAINAAKKTSELIPLCHNIFLSFVDVSYKINREEGYIEAVSEVKTEAKTGAEMEAITAVVIFLETVYDMCKAVKKDMVISDIRLIEKSGGKSGHYIFKNENKTAKVVSINISRQKGTPKEPVSEAVLIENYGIEGDAHAGTSHRQVSLLDISSIKKMQQYGLKGLCFGKFAENITTENLDLQKISLGTKLKIGNNVLLEISQIGKKCHGSGCEIAKSVGVCIMPKEGLFAKVLIGGKVKVGDNIEILNE